MSSLVLIRQGRKAQFSDEQKRDVARTLDIDFIKLEYTDAEYINTPYSVMGFQAVTISVVQRGQRTVRVPKWSTDEEGRPVSKGELVFKPDELNRGLAYLPDSPMNRRKLASAMSGKKAPWRVVDDEIRAEIEKMAQMWREQPDIVKALEHIEQLKMEEKVAREEQKRQGQFGTSPLDSELQVWEQKIAELEKEQKLKELKAKYQELVKPQGKSIEATETPARSGNRNSGTPSYNQKAEAARKGRVLRQRIKKEVHAEMSDLITRLAAERPNGWSTCVEYNDKVKPVIEQRIAQELGNADNTGTNNDS